MPSKRARRGGRRATESFHQSSQLERKRLDKLPTSLAPLHVIANYCMKEAHGSDTWAERAVEVRSPPPSTGADHDPELRRRIEEAAGLRDALSGIGAKWRDLATRADTLATDILAAQRADVDALYAVEEADHRLHHLLESHNARLHPRPSTESHNASLTPKGRSKAK